MAESKSARHGILWGTIDTFVRQGVQFVIGIVLARLLSPEEFGILGILTIFLSLSDLLIESGFSQALIRKNKISNEEYSTVFYFNLGVSFILYFLIFFSSDFFEVYFRVEGLAMMLKVFMLKIIISSFYFTQSVMLTKSLDFKIFTKITFFSSVISGGLGIILAYNNYGAWSLIWQSLSATLLIAILVNFFRFWKPNFIFRWIEINNLYKVSSYLLFTSILGRFANEMNTFIIGRYFSPETLGFYTRANSLKNLPSQTFNTILSKVSLPILSNKQDDPDELQKMYKKLFSTSFFISSFVMLLLISISDDLILVLLGEKWRGTIILFQYLSIIGIFYPLNALNNNLIIARGKTRLTFKLALFKFFTTIPVLIIGVLTNINNLIIGLVIISIFHTLIYCYFSGRIINYKLIEQLTEMFRNIWFLILICIMLNFINLSNMSNWSSLIIKSSIFIILTILFSMILKNEIFILFKKYLIKFYISRF